MICEILHSDTKLFLSDIIVYNCQLCSFESHNRNSLSDHYIEVHGVEATKEQLKPKTKSPVTTSSSFSSNRALMKNDDYLMETNTNDQYQILSDTTQSPYDTRPTTFSSSSGSQQVNALSTTTETNYAALTTTPYSSIDGDPSSNVNSDLNIADEFIVLADGSVEKVMGKGMHDDTDDSLN